MGGDGGWSRPGWRVGVVGRGREVVGGVVVVVVVVGNELGCDWLIGTCSLSFFGLWMDNWVSGVGGRPYSRRRWLINIKHGENWPILNRFWPFWPKFWPFWSKFWPLFPPIRSFPHPSLLIPIGSPRQSPVMLRAMHNSSKSSSSRVNLSQSAKLRLS